MTIDKIQKLAKVINENLDDRYRDYGLTSKQVDLLLYFYNNQSNTISANAALEFLDRDKRLMSLSIKSLEEKGYISRTTNSVDKRQKDIELTLNALEICEDLIGIKQEVEFLFKLNLSEEQIEAISTIENDCIPS